MAYKKKAILGIIIKIIATAATALLTVIGGAETLNNM